VETGDRKNGGFCGAIFYFDLPFPAFSGGARPFPIGHLSEGGHIK
jgi:hypothetical protein